MPRYAVLLFSLTTSCSVLSHQARQQASRVPFERLIDQPDDWQGELVILGGYVLEVEGNDDRSFIAILQTPLRAGDVPGRREHSAGRLLLKVRGFVDPEAVREGEPITVVGVVRGRTRRSRLCPATCLKLDSREVHIGRQATASWRPYDPYSHLGFYWYYPWYSSHHNYGYPYRQHHYYYDRHHQHRRQRRHRHRR